MHYAELLNGSHNANRELAIIPVMVFPCLDYLNTHSFWIWNICHATIINLNYTGEKKWKKKTPTHIWSFYCSACTRTVWHTHTHTYTPCRERFLSKHLHIVVRDPLSSSFLWLSIIYFWCREENSFAEHKESNFLLLIYTFINFMSKTHWKQKWASSHPHAQKWHENEALTNDFDSITCSIK